MFQLSPPACIASLNFAVLCVQSDYKFHVTYFGDNSRSYVKAESVVLYSEDNLKRLVVKGKHKGRKARAAALSEAAAAAAVAAAEGL